MELRQWGCCFLGNLSNLLSSSTFSLYLGGNAYVTAFDFALFTWPHLDFGDESALSKDGVYK